MQLIFDSDTDTDIRKNMAVINSENINEKFSSDRLLDKFSQNECVEKCQEDIKKTDDAEINSKDNIENTSNIEIFDSNSNDVDEKVRQVQNLENKNKDDSKNIISCHLDNKESGTSDTETPSHEFGKKCYLKGESLTENDETDKKMVPKVNSEKPLPEIGSSSKIKNTSSLCSEENFLNKDESATSSEISSKIYSEKMDVDDDHQRNDVSRVSQSSEKLKSIVKVPKYDKTIREKEIHVKDESVESKQQPNTIATSSQYHLDDETKNDDVIVANHVDSIVDSSEMKPDDTLKVRKIDTLLMTVSDKSNNSEILQVSNKNNVHPNTIEINDDSSQDDIGQAETSPANKDKVVSNEEVNNKVIKDNTLNSKELSNFDEKEETIANIHKDSGKMTNEPKIEQDKSIDVQKKLSIEDSNVIKPLKSKLSNTLDILSDDDDSHVSKQKKALQETNKQSVNVEDDDDILLIDDEDTSNRENQVPLSNLTNIPEKDVKEILENNQAHAEEKLETLTDNNVAVVAKEMNESVEKAENVTAESHTEKFKSEADVQSSPPSKPLLPTNFLSMCKKNVSEMTRNDLEEFCIMKIVESVVDRGNIGEMKSQLKKMAVSLDEHRNRIKSITKQNQDLQVVLRSIQEACRKNSLVTPIKITRSVGIQVAMDEKAKQKATIVPHQNNATTSSSAKPVRSPSLQNKSKQITTPPQNIPVPRLVPAKNSPSNIMQNQTPSNKVPNNLQPTPIRPAVPRPEKRSFSKSQTGSDTVDLTDDEPPNKVVTRPGNQTVRVVSPQNLMPPQHRIQMANSPRKVYIPIGGGQAPSVRPTSPFMLKNVNNQNVRQRVPGMRRGHPAPLPESGKQYQAPSWKAIPPAPEIKLSKVDNGIIISWKLDNYRDDTHEDIASYQIYAYQETPSPPNTNLWKKIGDVKALPLPMACTLTQFVPGFKYYFAVRAVDVRSRQGTFSNPGNIMLLNK